MRINAWRFGLFVAMSVSFTSTALSNDLLKKMDGRWKGEGWAKRAASGAREVVRCRLHNKYFPKKAELVVSGKCVVPGKKFDLKGAVSSPNGSKEVSGRWANPFGFRQHKREGHANRKSGGAEFQRSGPDDKKRHQAANELANISQWIPHNQYGARRR